MRESTKWHGAQMLRAFAQKSLIASQSRTKCRRDVTINIQNRETSESSLTAKDTKQNYIQLTIQSFLIII